MRIILNDDNSLASVIAARGPQDCIIICDTPDPRVLAYSGPSGVFNGYGYGAPWGEMEDAVADIIAALGDDTAAVMPAWDLTHMESAATVFAALDVGGVPVVTRDKSLSGLMQAATDNGVVSIICNERQAQTICEDMATEVAASSLRRLVVMDEGFTEGERAELAALSGLTVVAIPAHCGYWKSPGRGLRAFPDLPDLG